MKKITFAFACTAAVAAVFAQEPTTPSPAIKTPGNKTAEVVLNFQTGTAPVNYRLGAANALGQPELRFRYFKNDNLAFRLRAGMGLTSTTTDVSDGAPVPAFAEVKNSSGFNLVLAPGIEKHFAPGDKFSPYFGLELPLAYGTGSTIEVSNAAVPNPAPGDVAAGNSYTLENGTIMGMGLNAFLGADYRFAQSFYVGLEMGMGLLNITQQAEGREVTVVGPLTFANSIGRTSTISVFGAYAGGVRLGFRF